MSGAAIDEAALVALAQALVRCPSPQTAKMEAEPAVQSFIGECVVPRLAALGLHGKRDAMGNLLIELGSGESDRSLLLVAYAMTHPASSMVEPFSGDIVETAEGPAIRGRGVSEQKGAMAAAFIAAAAAQRSGRLRGRLVLAVSSAGETGRHDAAAAMLAAMGPVPPLGIVALGTNNAVALGNKGRIDVHVTVHGKSVHSATPWAGIDAIAGAKAVLDCLDGLTLGGEAHPFLGLASLTPTAIESFPKATHTLQDRVILTFDRRLLPGQAPDPAFDQIRDAVAAIGGPWRIEVTRGAFMYPSEVALDSRISRGIADARARRGLPAPATLFCHAALDAGYFVERGCETVMWGPGRMEQFHVAEETLLVSELAAGARDYLAFIEDWPG